MATMPVDKGFVVASPLGPRWGTTHWGVDYGVGGASALVTGTVEIRLHRNWSLGSDSFTGHVYTVKM